MKRKILLCCLAVALGAGGFVANRALAGNGADAFSGRAGLLQRIASKLNLTADQRTQIKAVLVGEKDTLAPLLAAVHDARKNLRDAIRAGGATETSVRAASAKVASAEADLAVERMKLYGKIAPILTDAQREQLAGMQQRADDFVDHVIARIGSGLAD
jgi:Spy/CpxP family protein refolding chaperone